jgi:hypothetical protein
LLIGISLLKTLCSLSASTLPNDCFLAHAFPTGFSSKILNCWPVVAPAADSTTFSPAPSA